MAASHQAVRAVSATSRMRSMHSIALMPSVEIVSLHPPVRGMSAEVRYVGMPMSLRHQRLMARSTPWAWVPTVNSSRLSTSQPSSWNVVSRLVPTFGDSDLVGVQPAVLEEVDVAGLAGVEASALDALGAHTPRSGPLVMFRPNDSCWWRRFRFRRGTGRRGSVGKAGSHSRKVDVGDPRQCVT